MLYVLPPLNLVRLSFNVSPEYKYLDTNIFNINSNENMIMYIFVLNTKILSESHLDIFYSSFIKGVNKKSLG